MSSINRTTMAFGMLAGILFLAIGGQMFSAVSSGLQLDFKTCGVNDAGDAACSVDRADVRGDEIEGTNTAGLKNSVGGNIEWSQLSSDFREEINASGVKFERNAQGVIERPTGSSWNGNQCTVTVELNTAQTEEGFSKARVVMTGTMVKPHKFGCQFSSSNLESITCLNDICRDRSGTPDVFGSRAEDGNLEVAYFTGDSGAGKVTEPRPKPGDQDVFTQIIIALENLLGVNL